MQVRDEIQTFKESTGSQPSVIFLKNHGVFVAGNTPEQIHESYNEIVTKLKQKYQQENIPTQLKTGPVPDDARLKTVRQRIRQAYDDETISIAGAGRRVQLLFFSNYLLLNELKLFPTNVIAAYMMFLYCLQVMKYKLWIALVTYLSYCISNLLFRKAALFRPVCPFKDAIITHFFAF